MFDGQKFLKFSTILGGHQLSQLYAKLCQIILFQLGFFRVEVSLSFSWIHFSFWGSLWTVYAVRAENSVSLLLLAFQCTSTA